MSRDRYAPVGRFPVGELATFLSALDQPSRSAEVMAATVLVGPGSVEESYGEERFWIFTPSGTDFMFRHGKLVAVMIRVQDDPADPSYRPYPPPDALIDGLPALPSPAELTAVLGEPQRQTPSWVRFSVGDRHLHFALDEEQKVTMVTAMTYAP